MMGEIIEKEFENIKEQCSHSMNRKLFNRMLMNQEFDYDEQDFHFGISHAIIANNGKPFCYTDNECKAELLTFALNEYKGLKEDNLMLKMVLKDLFSNDCGCSDCRAITGNVSHDYCKYHQKIILALEECER